MKQLFLLVEEPVERSNGGKMGVDNCFEKFTVKVRIILAIVCRGG